LLQLFPVTQTRCQTISGATTKELPAKVNTTLENKELAKVQWLQSTILVYCLDTWGNVGCGSNCCNYRADFPQSSQLINADHPQFREIVYANLCLNPLHPLYYLTFSTSATLNWWLHLQKRHGLNSLTSLVEQSVNTPSVSILCPKGLQGHNIHTVFATK
jgi:hypothetical protein